MKLAIHARLLVISLFLFGFASASYSQVVVDLPVNNSVFQRNQSNQANINIAGTYANKAVSSIQARLLYAGTTSVVTGFNWTIIDTYPTKGMFYGTLSNVSAGWYTLEIRVMKSGTVLSSTSVNRVGVGDVFLAFGQSNAQGYPGIAGLSANSEKVISHNYIDSCSQQTPNFPVLSKISGASNVGQHGVGSWYWGRFGDNLTNITGVPVAVYNGATAAASVGNFVDSFNGGATNHPFTGNQFCHGINPDFPSGIGTPYLTFLRTIQYYNSIYGIRAILWMQGESDNLLGTDQGTFTNRLSTIIARTRSDFGYNIPWVVARTSYYNGGTSAAVINGENSVLNTANQVFTGPSTDDITLANYGSNYRDDNVHFNGQGHVLVADRWANVLTSQIYPSSQTFFNLSVPKSANSLPKLTSTISGSNVTLTAPSGYAAYKWVTTDNFKSPAVSTSQSLTSSGNNTYRCFMTTNTGNIVMSQKVNMSGVINQQSIPNTCNGGGVFLSDYGPYSAINGWGPVEFDKSNGGLGDGDGVPLKLNNVSFSKGIGTHAGSEIVYKIPQSSYNFFTATIGIDDNITSGGSVIFKVYLDNVLKYTSPLMTSSSANQLVSVPLLNASTLKLVVEDGGDGISSDHADWANAQLICDDISPSDPSSLSVTDIKTRCLKLNWSASIDNIGVTAYELFLDGNFVETVGTSTLSYVFGNLNRSTSYTLGVRAVDIAGNKSAISTIQGSTNGLSITYAPSNQVCVGVTYMPVNTQPGGTYQILSGGGIATLNTSTGELLINSPGDVQIRYEYEVGTGCEETANFFVTSYTQPGPPVISSTTTLLNKGSSVTLSSNTNCSPYSLEWSNAITNVSFSATPLDTTTYFARCLNIFCYSNQSNTITVKVIPDCPQTFNLASTASDLNHGVASYNFSAAQSIDATNKIKNPTGAIFKAGKKIELKPGFSIEAGSVFSATIQGCP